MQATHYFKNHSKIASFIGAIFIGLACFGAAQTAQAKTPTLPLQASIQEQKTQIQPASSAWQMPMDVTTVPNAGRVQEQGKVEVVEFFCTVARTARTLSLQLLSGARRNRQK